MEPIKRFPGPRCGSECSSELATDIHFAPRAERDLSAIIEFMGATSQLAERFAERFDLGIEQLLLFPESAPADDFGA